MGHYYVVVRFIFSLHFLIFTVQPYSFSELATNTNPNNLCHYGIPAGGSSGPQV